MFFDKYNNIDCKEIIQECIFYVNIAESLLFSVGSSLYLPSNKSCKCFFAQKIRAFFRSVIPVIISQFLRHISHKITNDTLFFGYT